MQAVVQMTEEEIPVDVLVPILVEYGGMIELDARRVANRNKGIIFDRFDIRQANDVAGALASAGLEVHVLHSQDIPKLPKVHVPAWLMFSAAGLAFPLGLDQKVTIVPWTSVFVVNSTDMHLVERDEISIVPADSEGEFHSSVSGAKPTPVTDVIALPNDGSLCNLRIIKGRTKHRDGTSAASDSVSSPLAEYFEIVQTIVNNSTDAMISAATQQRLQQQRNSPGLSHSDSWARFEELAYRKYNRWMLLMVVLRDQD